MNETRKDLGYNDEMPSTESQAWMKNYLAGNQQSKPQADTEPDWRLDEETKQTGLEGVHKSREALHAVTPPHKIAVIERNMQINDIRTRLEIQRKARSGEPLSPQETEILNLIHRSQSQD